MIYDRTQEDIESAKRIIVEKVQKFYELSYEELEILERGTVTLDTVNRIAKKQDELLRLFISLGYYGGKFDPIEFAVGEIFNERDLNSLINRNEILRPIFFTYASTPGMAKSEYTYTAFNDIERLLFDLEEMYEFVVANTRECNTFDSGEE